MKSKFQKYKKFWIGLFILIFVVAFFLVFYYFMDQYNFHIDGSKNDISNTANDPSTLSQNNVNGANWMSKIPGDKNINDINIPGTHDSGTKYVDFSLFGHYRTQDTTITEQLELGCRFFDIRLCYEPNTDGQLCLCHSIAKCEDESGHYLSYTSDALSCFKDFLKNHEGEVIIIAPKRERGEVSDYADKMREWWELAKGEKGVSGNLYFCENRLPKLDEVRGKIVILNRGKDFCDGWNDVAESIGYKISIDTYEEITDAYQLENHWNIPAPEKLEWVKNYLDGQNPKQNLRVCYTSSNCFANKPIKVAKTVNTELLQQYQFKSGVKYGWFLMDFVGANTDFHINPKTIYSLNFI